MGRKLHLSKGASAALPFFHRAVELDANFAIAHIWMAQSYANLDEFVLAKRSVEAADRLRAHAGNAERFDIATSYDRLVTGNMEKMTRTCELWSGAFPREAKPHGLLSGMS